MLFSRDSRVANPVRFEAHTRRPWWAVLRRLLFFRRIDAGAVSQRWLIERRQDEWGLTYQPESASRVRR